MANISPGSSSFNSSITLVAQSPPSVLYEAQIRELLVAHLATKALGVPVGVHGLDDPSNDEDSAFGAARRKKDLEVVFAVLSAFEFVEDAVFEFLEALSTSKNSVNFSLQKSCILFFYLLLYFSERSFFNLRSEVF